MKNNINRGFSLIEVIVSIAVFSILLFFVTFSFNSSTNILNSSNISISNRIKNVSNLEKELAKKDVTAEVIYEKVMTNATTTTVKNQTNTLEKITTLPPKLELPTEIVSIIANKVTPTGQKYIVKEKRIYPMGVTREQTILSKNINSTSNKISMENRKVAKPPEQTLQLELISGFDSSFPKTIECSVKEIENNKIFILKSYKQNLVNNNDKTKN